MGKGRILCSIESIIAGFTETQLQGRQQMTVVGSHCRPRLFCILEMNRTEDAHPAAMGRRGYRSPSAGPERGVNVWEFHGPFEREPLSVRPTLAGTIRLPLLSLRRSCSPATGPVTTAAEFCSLARFHTAIRIAATQAPGR